jgi:putative phosphoribosyl transferase
MSTALAMPTTFTAHIPAGDARLHADVVIPYAARGVVLFAHGSGSGRQSARNRYVSSELNMVGLATVLVDLLTPDESRRDERSGAIRFDVPFLADRVASMLDWVASFEPFDGRAVGLFGASTGAAAALDASAARPEIVRAVVSRGGRTDLASDIGQVHAPTLLIVGANDSAVLQRNSEALRMLNCRRRLEVVPGATHLFEEPGALERVAALSAAWFHEHLAL